MAKNVTKEKARLALSVAFNKATWNKATYEQNLAVLMATVALNAQLAMKDTEDGNEAAASIADCVAVFVQNPEKVRDFGQRCVKAFPALYVDVRPDQDAADQAQLNNFAAQVLQVYGLTERIHEVINRLQVHQDPLWRLYSPISWKKYWPWVSSNFFNCAA